MSTVHPNSVEHSTAVSVVAETRKLDPFNNADQGTGLYFRRVRNWLRRTMAFFAAAAHAASQGTQPKQERSTRLLRIIVERKPRPVGLFEVLADSPPFVFKDEDMLDVWCLIVSGESFSLNDAIDWVKATTKLNIEAGRNHVASMMVIADIYKLSRQDLYRVASELEPHGAIFARWPEGAVSTDDALNKIVPQMTAAYGPSEFNSSKSLEEISLNQSMVSTVNR